MSPPSLFEAILEQHRKLLERVSRDEIDHFIGELHKARRVFFAAHGRSGYVLRCFAMRLMQMGYQVFFVGETVTPNIKMGDLLVVLSGSGRTSLTREWIRIAHEQKARAFGILGVKNSPMGEALDLCLTLDAGSKLDRAAASPTAQPPGSLFEQAAFLLLESVVLTVCETQGIDPATILERHANLE